MKNCSNDGTILMGEAFDFLLALWEHLFFFQFFLIISFNYLMVVLFYLVKRSKTLCANVCFIIPLFCIVNVQILHNNVKMPENVILSNKVICPG